jgi:glycerol-1-phosphatase
MSLLAEYEAFLFDLDGVLYRGADPIPGSAETIRAIRDGDRRVAFVTNNSSRTPGQVAALLQTMTIEAHPGEVVTSALATAWVLGRRGVRSAFVVGEAGIRDALEEAGIEVRDGAADQVDVVVVGWDRSADYEKLKTAGLLVQRGARLVATNPDPSYPAPDGLWPGAGALLAAITTTTGAIPDVIGKPYPPLFEEARRLVGPARTLVVGDRLDTDIAGAAALGLDSILVLSGVSQAAELLQARELPTYVGTDVSVLSQEPAPARIRAARPEDAADVATLLGATGLDAADADTRLTTTLVAQEIGPRQGARAIVGTAALEIYGPLAHLRSVAVDESRRGSRLGSALVAGAVRMARSARCEAVYVVTETAAPFFGSLGFEEIGTVQDLPAQVRTTPLVRDQCATTAAALKLDLDRRRASDGAGS